MKWCPRCQKMVYAIKHTFADELRVENRCSECGLTLDVLHLAPEKKKPKKPRNVVWEVR